MNSGDVDFKDLSIIIPVFNEGAVIGNLLKDIRHLYPGAAIIVIDDGSSDNSKSEIERVQGVSVITHQHNLGYGASLKNGVRAATTKVVCWFDADNQHDPKDILNVSQPVLCGEVVACFGVRNGMRNQQYRRLPGKYLLTRIGEAITAQKIPDINCGLRAFKRTVLVKYLHLLANRFSASLTTTLIMIKRGYNIRWVDISLRAREGRSTVSILKDGMRTLVCIYRMAVLFSALKVFTVCAGILLTAGVLWGLYVQFAVGMGVSSFAVGLVILGVLVFLMGIVIDQVSEIRKERYEDYGDFNSRYEGGR